MFQGIRMNDITQTLVRSVLKIGAGYFLAKGLIDQQGSEELISALVGLISVLWGVCHRAPAAATKPGATIGLVLLLGLSGATLSGCATAQQTAYKSEGAAIITVDAAMSAWGDYVRAGKADAITQAKVKQAYDLYFKAMQVNRDATLAYVANKTDAGPAQASLIAVSASAGDLIALVQQIINLNQGK